MKKIGNLLLKMSDWPWANRAGACALLMLLIATVTLTKAQQGTLISAPPKQSAKPAPPDSSSANNTAKPLNSAAQPVNQSPTSAASPIEQTDNRYRIGPGDVLDIRVLKAPELSRESVRVDQHGTIRMPMLDEDIPAACLTEGELSQAIAKLYLKYKRSPHVDVFVKEFQSQPVAVIGAVNQPGQFKLQRQVRLLEILTFAGGQHERAGQVVQIVHAGGPSLCEQANAPAEGEKESITNGFISYKLSDTLRGIPGSNPWVRPGDIISVPDADQIYVVGNVMKPSAIPMKEPLTVSRAIAMAGGTSPDSKKDKVRVIRQLPGSTTKQEIYVDLKAIEKRKADDIALQANDIVDVPSSTGRTILRSLIGTIAPTVGQLPVRVIP